MSAATLSHNPTPKVDDMDGIAPMKRRMTLPTEPKREDPIYIPAEKPASDPAHGAAFILVHGLGDNAEGLQAVPQQFQSAHKLPYMHWIIPNAMESREAMTTAWYTPSSFSAFPPDRPELAPEEDAEGMFATVKYIESLIDACTRKGIPPNRIILGGFSQGCAMALLTDLTSEKYAGKLGGIVGLMGYLPLSGGRKLEDLRAEAGLPPVHGQVPILLARGKKDQMIPVRVWKETLKRLEELGVESDLEVHEYEGLGHSLSGPVLRDICTFAERLEPKFDSHLPAKAYCRFIYPLCRVVGIEEEQNWPSGQQPSKPGDSESAVDERQPLPAWSLPVKNKICNAMFGMCSDGRARKSLLSRSQTSTIAIAIPNKKHAMLHLNDKLNMTPPITIMPAAITAACFGPAPLRPNHDSKPSSPNTRILPFNSIGIVQMAMSTSEGMKRGPALSSDHRNARMSLALVDGDHDFNFRRWLTDRT
ncbi:hypothetical protein BST61_g2616 [Cercospora zeina]